MKPISYPQMKKIFGLSKVLKLHEEELRALVKQVSGSDSIKAMTMDQGRRVIDRLTRLAGQQNARQRAKATPNQIWQINKLAEELGWHNDPRRLRRFVENQQGVSHPSYLTPEAASKVIEALKAMKRRHSKGVIR